MRAGITDTRATTYQAAGARVTAYRRTHGTRDASGRRVPLSQVTLARRAGVSPGALAGFENGTRLTTRTIAAKIAAACELTLDQLFAPEDGAAPVPALPLSDEAIEIAQWWTLANTDVRVDIRRQLVTHLASRQDLPPLAVVEKLRSQVGGGGHPVAAHSGKESSPPAVAAEHERPFRRPAPPQYNVHR